MDEGRRVFERRLRALGWVSYLLILTPILTEFIEDGGLPRDLRAWLTEVVIGLLVLGFALVLRRTHREIIELNELRRTLTDSLVHDLKNPMTTVLGALSVLQDDGTPPETAKTLLNVALRSCRWQVRLIDSILDTGRIEDACMPVARRRLDAAGFLRDCVDEVALIASTGEVAVEILRPDGGPSFSGDPDLLRRAVLNLVWNALRHTHKGGTVTLDCRAEGPDCVIEVADNGIGIPPEGIGKLFQKYARIEGDGRKAVRGTGLGLYFCRLVVEAHGGRVGIRSAKGQGTTVTLRLPGAVLPAVSPEGEPGPG